MSLHVRRVVATTSLAFVFIACSAAPSATRCAPTVAHMRPPDEVIDFFAAGAHPAVPRETVLAENWYGNAAMWVALPPGGEIVGRLDDKIAPYRMKRGHVQYQARQLDGVGAVPRQPLGPADYGDISFQAGGPHFPSSGCWAVTYVLDGNDPLEFVLYVH